MSAPALTLDRLDPAQLRAVDVMCSARCAVITGGPGVGKSTTLRFALDRLDQRGERYALASPTGKAAKRLNETTGRPAGTIHRLLGFGREGFTFTRDNPLPFDAVFVDESSMMDIELGAALLRAIDPGRTRLILIGDANQLPPVGPGRPFGDLCDWGRVPMVRLETLHRSAHESWIHVAAQRMLRGELPDLEPRADFRFAECGDAKWLLPKVRRLATEVFPAKIDAVAQVLIPQRPGVAGIDAANRMLQEALNPRTRDAPYLERKAGGGELRIGDRVIHTRNNYTLQVFNGETGTVLDIGAEGVTVQYPDRAAVQYTVPEALAQLQLAYALTVHRSQGSEFAWVIVVVHSTHSFILSRQLVYTAITRAKRGVVLVGDIKGLERALANRRAAKRNTSVIERLEGTLDDDAASGGEEG
jgi:exodeoxyribonuclease V alpha subunit